MSLYISHLASRVAPVSLSTIHRRLAAISFAHRQQSLDSPATPRKHIVLHEVLAGIKRTLGATQRGADPLLVAAIRRIVAASPATLLGTRDRALCLLGFATGLRRSELASVIGVRDLQFTGRGLYIFIRHSKSERYEDHPRLVAVPFGEHQKTCPVLAVRAWIDAARIREGPLFRAVDSHGNVSQRPLSPRSIAKILARAAARAGIRGKVSPHSLRAGMCTQAALMGLRRGTSPGQRDIGQWRWCGGTFAARI